MSRKYTAEDITWATRRLDLAMSRLMVALSRDLGISVPEMLALEYLDADGSIGPSELAHRLQMTSGAMTALVDRLEPRRPRHGGVVDEHVEAPAAADDQLNDRAHDVGVPDVARRGDGRLTELGCQRVRALARPDVDGDARAVVEEVLGGRAAQAAGRTGDEDDAVSECAHGTDRHRCRRCALCS